MVFHTMYIGGESTEGLTAVNPARFQVLDVDERCDIKTFVQRNGLIFKTGRGFYEFTKAEKISDKKEVVLVDKVHVCKSQKTLGVLPVTKYNMSSSADA